MHIPSHDHTDVFRDPIHGLIKVYTWEKKLIDSPEFQRLRRIHQLSMTNLVYHGAEHTRFEHSIGVMHVAGRVMDHLREAEPLKNLSEEEFLQKKAMVRLAGLLHDLGHGCYSHIGEEEKIYPDLIDPLNGEIASGHEAYTRCIIKERMAGIINEFWPDSEHHMVPHILMILNQSSDDPAYRFFDDIISGQLDCDKMDYLLRDSHYCGVEYGIYDLEKLIDSLTVVSIHDNSVLAIRQNGIQAVEGFILARYWMFIQVYFHKYRRLFDYYLSSFMKELFTLEYEKSGQYPKSMKNYLEMDDYFLYEKIKSYANKEYIADNEQKICFFARNLYLRSHHKVVFDPPYVHYDSRNGEGNEEYKRLNYVKRQLKEYLDKQKSSVDNYEIQNRKVYVDLATGSTTKHLFDIKGYNDEHDPDYSTSAKEVEVPAIPVQPKHGGEPVAIQKYSFTLRSISDKKISILRIYADMDRMDDIRRKCEEWFTVDYNIKLKEYNELSEQRKQKEKELQDISERQSSLEKLFGTDESV